MEEYAVILHYTCEIVGLIYPTPYLTPVRGKRLLLGAADEAISGCTYLQRRGTRQNHELSRWCEKHDKSFPWGPAQ